MGFFRSLIAGAVSLIPGVGPVAAAAIGAGGQLIGGALDARAQAKDRQYAIDNRGVDFKKLRDDAIAAGFNPLTALNATGGQGYDRVAGVPSLASSAFIGDAIASFGKSMFDLRVQESDQLASAQLAYGLQGMRVGMDTGPTSYSMPPLGMPGSSPDNPIPTTSWYLNKVTGNVFEGPNVDLMDMSPGELVASTSILAASEAGGFVLGHNNPGNVVTGTPFRWGDPVANPTPQQSWGGGGWDYFRLPSLAAPSGGVLELPGGP